MPALDLEEAPRRGSREHRDRWHLRGRGTAAGGAMRGGPGAASGGAARPRRRGERGTAPRGQGQPGHTCGGSTDPGGLSHEWRGWVGFK